MKKVYPLGNKISDLLEESNEDYYNNDVPREDPVEYKTQTELPDLPKGGYGYAREDEDTPIIPPKKKRKFLEELPPKDNIEDEIDIEFTDEDESAENNEIKEQNEFTAKKQGEEDQSGMNSNMMTNTDPNIMSQDPNAMTNMDPNIMSQDPNAMTNMDPNFQQQQMGPTMGVPVEPKKTAEEIGRIFELKKIYSRLLSIEQHLSFSSDDLLLKLRDFVSQSIELFETVISNIDSFKNELDDIIVMFYKFLEYVYNIMTRYYKIKEKEEKSSKLFTKQPIDKEKAKKIEKSGGYVFRLTSGI